MPKFESLSFFTHHTHIGLVSSRFFSALLTSHNHIQINVHTNTSSWASS